MPFQPFLLTALTFSAAIFGFFYAWVCSIMWGLDQMVPSAAIEAMNAMNASVRNGVFMPAFFGTPIVLVLVSALAWGTQRKTVALWLVAAALTYVLGAFIPTATVNVPMNQALMTTDMTQDADALAQIWATYSAKWQVWNIARTVASGVSLLMVGAALLAAPLAGRRVQA